MTLPFIPLAFVATLRIRTVDMALLGGVLGSMFWGHSPIALWTTAAAGVAQVVRIIASPRSNLSRAHLKTYVMGAIVFAMIGGFPQSSVLFFLWKKESEAQTCSARPSTGSFTSSIRFIRRRFTR